MMTREQELEVMDKQLAIFNWAAQPLPMKVTPAQLRRAERIQRRNERQVARFAKRHKFTEPELILGLWSTP